MDLSHEWRSLWCIGSVFPAPHLLTSASAEPLGPLLFNPVGSPNYWHISSPYVSLEKPFSKYSADLHLLDRYQSEALLPQTAAFLGNRLESFKVSTNKIRIFFPDAADESRISSLTVNHEDSTHYVNPASVSLKHSVLQLVAAENTDDGWNNDGTSKEGILLARTLYGVHWLRLSEEKYSLKYLGFANFGKQVWHVCASPHIGQESAAILDSGEVRLFDIENLKDSASPLRFHGKVLPLEATSGTKGLPEGWEMSLTCNKYYHQGISETDFQRDADAADLRGWCCEFAWHPRTLLVAGRREVKLVDLRTKKDRVSDYSSLVAEARMPLSYCSMAPKKDTFLSLAMADHDLFKFALGSRQHVFLFDSRMHLTPLVQWEHGLQRGPNYLKIYGLSELRTALGSDYRWASDNGKAILAASFVSNDVRLFSYGPHPANSVESIPDDADIPDPLYAWELPSKILTVNEDDGLDIEYGLSFKHCVRSHGSGRKGSLQGICIISDQVSGSSISRDEKNEGKQFSGFTLVQLTEGLDVLSQRFEASRELEKRRPRAKRGISEGLIPDLSYLTKKKQRNERKRKLPHLIDYVKDGSFYKPSLEIPSSGLDLTMQDEDLQDEDIDRFLDSFLQENKDLFSIYEIACLILWMSLPTKNFCLAFVNQLKCYKRHIPTVFFHFPEVVNIKRPLLELDDVERKYECAIWQDLWGPILPLPFLMGRMRRGTAFDFQDKIKHISQRICERLGNLQKVERFRQLFDFSLSLSDDVHMSTEQEEKQEYVVRHKPSWNSDKDKDESSLSTILDAGLHNEFVANVRGISFSDNGDTSITQSLIDEGLCPIKLNYDERELELSKEELDGLTILKHKYQSKLQTMDFYQSYLNGLSFYSY
eukprot:TRINITY_DN1501_c0_g1_i3.p1 TRINITY_DN1501_c0_g1~~TRINITY_DN1501_c0_g1_i3.p1  ORF type:complete len:878 (+),score=108.54 TRINITY_DN1501_c0_g1_i3:2-2635(+)